MTCNANCCGMMLSTTTCRAIPQHEENAMTQTKVTWHNAQCSHTMALCAMLQQHKEKFCGKCATLLPMPEHDMQCSCQCHCTRKTVVNTMIQRKNAVAWQCCHGIKMLWHDVTNVTEWAQRAMQKGIDNGNAMLSHCRRGLLLLKKIMLNRGFSFPFVIIFPFCGEFLVYWHQHNLFWELCHHCPMWLMLADFLEVFVRLN